MIYKKPTIGKALSLHVFEPTVKASKPRSCIVFFFGGGWTGGTPKQFYQHSKDLAAKGIVAISAEYRTKSTHNTSPKDAVLDAHDAIRWVRQHAKDLSIDPNKIVAAGGSAGGHLAAATGVLTHVTKKSNESTPNAIILYNPVLDTTKNGYGSEKIGEDKNYLSPNHHVKKGISPTLVFHGTADRTVPFANAEKFTTLMKEAGNECTLVPFKGKDHGFFNSNYFSRSNSNQAYDKIMQRTLLFLKQHKFLQP